MTAILLTLYEDVFVAEFGKRAKRHMIAVMCDLFVVDNKLKPAYLWDLLQPNPHKINNLLNYLYGKCALKTLLNVITIGEDVFVVNLQELIFHIQKQLGTTRQTFLVDVSKTLEIPLMAGGQAHSLFVFHLKRILTQLKNFLASTENENFLPNTGNILTVEVDDCWNLSTLFGTLLGYPVVYYCKNNEGNCLSFCPLRVYSIDLMILSKNDNDIQQHSIQQSDLTPISHTAYSFSVPAVLVEKVTNAIELWFSTLLERLHHQTSLIKLVMNHQTITPPVVAL